jgi:predicted O-linked N-acetylglucosamine transferase (SPINDLY family)
MSPPTPQQLLQQGFEHHQAHRLGEAEKLYRQALLIDPRNAEAHHFLGVIFQQLGRNAAAVDEITSAIAIDPSQAEFYYNLGNSLLHLKHFDRAIEAFQSAVRLDPALFEAIRNLGSAQMLADRADEAARSFATAAKLQPDAADVQNNLGMAQRSLGQLDQALECFRRAKSLQPSYRAAHDNYLYTLHFHPSYNAEAIFREHRDWAAAHADPLARPNVQFGNVRTSDRRLRIGYISPNFREHPVGRALLPLIEQSDRDQFITICYSDSAASANDLVYQRLRRRAGSWRDSARWSDAQLIEQIRQDAVDILVDTTLHMTGNRLSLFAQRAAPVQVTFIGYPATTGLSQIDFRITDPWLDPVGVSESVNSEELIRLPRSFWCYDDTVGTDEPAVGELAREGITFGSLNNPAKITEPVVETWAKILAAVPSSRLMLYATAHVNPGEPIRQKFQQFGIDPVRLLIIPRLPRQEYLRQYQQIDIALDPWPYNGHTTTCDALWMGVPVVSLAGQTSVARGGVSILSAMELPELLADSTDAYVAIATALAHDRDRLAAIRSSLRARMRKSPLMDAVGFTQDVERIYHQLWWRWCEKNP